MTATLTNFIGSLLPTYDEAVFREIHDAPSFLPPNVNQNSIRGVLMVMGCITVLHLALLFIVQRWTRVGGGSLKASYQLTNLLVNLILGLTGIYYEVFKVHDEEPVIKMIMGYDDLRLFAIAQIGYQAWALPIGLFFVGETTSMLIHHVAVICVAVRSFCAICKVGADSLLYKFCIFYTSSEQTTQQSQPRHSFTVASASLLHTFTA